MATDMVPVSNPLSIRPKSSEDSSGPNFLCAICSDMGWVLVPGRGAKPCECKLAAYRARKLATIPPEYQGIDLATLLPDPRRHPKQARAIARMRQEPDRNYILLGPHGVGKTALLMALYRRAIEEGRPAVWVYMADLIEELKDAEFNDEKVPSISVSALNSDAKTADRWFIAIDDFNVGKATAFAGVQILRILNTIYNYHHQLVITAHCTKAQLREHWAQSGEGYGGSIIRRIEQAQGAIVVDFFDQNV